MRWIFVVLLVACAGRPVVTEAVYHTDLDTAYLGARDAVAVKYGILEEHAAGWTFQTDWRDVPEHAARVRFIVAIIAPRPLRVDIVGVIEGQSGTSPAWLRSEVDRVRATIHERLRRYVIAKSP